MIINFESTELVNQPVRGTGKWIGPFDMVLDGKAVVDRKFPIGADRSVAWSRKNKSHTLSFSAHYIGPDAESVQTLFASYFMSLPGETGTLTLASVPYTNAVIASASLRMKGAHLEAKITVEF